MIKQSMEGASVDVRGAASLPDATGRSVNPDGADSTKGELPERRFRIMTEKGKSFRLSTLKGRREKNNARLQRNSSINGDLHKKLSSSRRRTCSVQ